MWRSKFYGAFVLNRRVDLHAIDATPARWRGDAGSSPLDGASTAASSPRNDLVKNCRVHPTHWLISTQAPALGSRRKIWVLLAEGRVDTSACSKLPRNFVVKPLESKDVQVTSRDAVIVVAPGVTQSWKIGYDLARNAGAPVVFLNSQLSERYSLGGPLDDVEEVYYLKPISKGFVYRAYPGGWQCIPAWKSTSVSGAPSSGEELAERAVKFDFHTGASWTSRTELKKSSWNIPVPSARRSASSRN